MNIFQTKISKSGCLHREVIFSDTNYTSNPVNYYLHTNFHVEMLEKADTIRHRHGHRRGCDQRGRHEPGQFQNTLSHLPNNTFTTIFASSHWLQSHHICKHMCKG